jgi:hypothetical protein
MKELVTLIRHLLEGLDIRRRWIALVGIFLTVLIVLFVLECWTGWNYYANLEKKIKLMSSLHELARNDIASNQDLYPIYQETVAELSRRKVFSPSIPSIGFASSVSFWKALTGALFWLSLAIAGLFGAFGKENKIAAAVILGIIAFLFGYIGTIIPTIKDPWVNYIGFPLLQVVVIVLVSDRAQKMKKKGS